MKDILFRGKQKNNGKWVEGGVDISDGLVFIIGKVRYYPDTIDSYTIDYYEEHPHYMHGNIAVDPETVSQFTGLLDKNEKKECGNEKICNSGKLLWKIFSGRFGFFFIY